MGLRIATSASSAPNPLTERPDLASLPPVKHRRLDAWIVSSCAALAALPLAFAACAGPPITSPIDGEPVCPDFETGAAHTKMVGSLRHPVHLTIKSGSTVVFKTTVSGLRTDKDVATRVLL